MSSDGVCIGGPRDGQTINPKDSNHYVIALPNGPMKLPDHAQAEMVKEMAFHQFVYERFELFGKTFWVPSNVREHENPINYILDRLSACYRPPYDGARDGY
jgi:hypothetical protein